MLDDASDIAAVVQCRQTPAVSADLSGLPYGTPVVQMYMCEYPDNLFATSMRRRMPYPVRGRRPDLSRHSQRLYRSLRAS